MNREQKRIATATMAKPKAKAKASKPQATTKRAADPTVKIKHSKSGQRLLQVRRRVWYKPLTWRYRQPVPAYKPLPKARILFWNTLKQLWQRKKLLLGIALVYGVLTLLLVRGLSASSDLTDLKTTLDLLLDGAGGKLVTALTTFSVLLASSGNGVTASSGVYQSTLLVVCSLAVIWALRQITAGHMPRLRDSFYQGMYPLVPFVLVFMLLSIQLVPLALGSNLYSIIISSGVAVHAWEALLWLGLLIVLSLWSLRMITASIFGLYIATLPDMTPLQAYRTARGLVYGRRLLIWRKLIFLPILLLLIAVLIELPIILFATPLASWVFFGLTTIALPIVHGYLYNLYRAML